MTTEVLAQLVQAGVPAFFGQGRVWYIKTASAAMTIICTKQGSGATIRKFANVGAGFKFVAKEGDGWDILQINSVLAQNVEIIIGDDDVDVANAVSVTGSVTTIASPAAAIADTVDNAQASASQTVIAANASRRQITIGVLSTATNPVRVSQAGGAGRGIEIQPGQNQTFIGTYALTVRNDNTFGGGGAATWYAEEES